MWGKKHQKGESKYANKSSLCAKGHSHRSKLESSICQMIHLREKAGELEFLGAEVHVVICGPEGHECNHRMKIEYIPDFKCRDLRTGNIIFIEAKGFEAPTWPSKKRLWMHYRTERLEIWKGTYLRPLLHEVING